MNQNTCTYESVFLRTTTDYGYTIGICDSCHEFIVMSPIRATVTDLLDYNWQITNIADRIGADRHELGNMLVRLQVDEIVKNGN